MVDSVLEQVANFISRLAKQFNRKASQVLMILLNHKSAGSFGAIAGFAIALAFTWKFLRSSSRTNINQQKRLGSAATSSRSTHSSGADPGAEEDLLTDGNSTGELLSQSEPSLQQIVRSKLKGSRKMTCQLLGVVFEESSPEELQKHASVRPSVVELLLEIAKCCDLYLMETVLDDESEARALLALEDAAFFRAGGLIKDKVLFCSTENGRISFVRQLESDWHIDTSLEIITQLVRFVRHQLYIRPVGSSSMSPNAYESTSLEQYFWAE